MAQLRATDQLRVATLLAAWHKAFGCYPTTIELASILRINQQSVSKRLREADRAGLVYNTGDRVRCWRPNPAALPAHLLVARPVVTPLGVVLQP